MLLEHGRTLAQKRIVRGSSGRDLFYYLVRAASHLQVTSILRFGTNRTTKTFLGKIPRPSVTSSTTAPSRWWQVRILAQARSRASSTASSRTPRRTQRCRRRLTGSTPKAKTSAILRTIVRCTISPQSCTCPSGVPSLTRLTNAPAGRNETLRLFPPAPTSSPRQVPHNAPPVVLGSVSVLPLSFYSSLSALTRLAIGEQGPPSWNLCLRPALRPPPRRAQLRLPGHLLAGTLARRRGAPRPLPRTPALSSAANFLFVFFGGRRADRARVRVRVRAQRRGVHPVLVWADELRREEPRDAADAHRRVRARTEVPCAADGGVGSQEVRGGV